MDGFNSKLNTAEEKLHLLKEQKKTSRMKHRETKGWKLQKRMLETRGYNEDLMSV